MIVDICVDMSGTSHFWSRWEKNFSHGPGPGPSEKKIWSRSRREKVLGLGPGPSQKYFGHGPGPKKHFGPGPDKKNFWSQDRDHFAHLYICEFYLFV